MGTQADLDTAQTLPKRQLRKRQGKELIGTGERQQRIDPLDLALIDLRAGDPVGDRAEPLLRPLQLDAPIFLR